jgi:hypothetical protein
MTLWVVSVSVISASTVAGVILYMNLKK